MPLRSRDRLAVVVPAHDEEELLPALLDSLRVARNRLPAGVACSIVVVADACTDGTVDVARSRLGRRDVVVTCAERCVGSARRVGTAVAVSDAGRPGTWLASTDADCVVPPTWLVDHLGFARAGVRAVAGVVALDDSDPVLTGRFRNKYRVAPDGTHDHVHGANLGMRSDAYLRAGGWRSVATAEDHDLWDRLRADGPVVHTNSLAVSTSARVVGRAPRGFADGLAELLAGVP